MAISPPPPHSDERHIGSDLVSSQIIGLSRSVFYSSTGSGSSGFQAESFLAVSGDTMDYTWDLPHGILTYGPSRGRQVTVLERPIPAHC